MKKIITEEADITTDESLDAKVLSFFTKAERAGISDEQAREPLNMSGVEESIKLKSLKILLEDNSEVSSEKSVDINTFASEVVRLIQHADTLLDIKGTIIIMAKNYLTHAYDESVGEELIDVLERNYELSVSAKQDDEANNDFAVGAMSVTA